jgi:hypothetical protein
MGFFAYLSRKDKEQLLKETASSFNNIFGWKYLLADVFGTAITTADSDVGKTLQNCK